MVELLDEKGRLFGVVNIVDLAVVVVVVAVVAAGVAVVFASESSDQSTTTITVEVRAENVQPYVASAIPGGAVSDGNVQRVVNRSITPTQVLVTTAEGDLVQRDHPRLKTVETTVDLTGTRVNGDLFYQDRSLRVGQPLALDFGAVRVTGNVTAIEAAGQ